MPTLYAEHDNGAGQTIVIVDCYGSPTIKQDLTTFDSATNGYDLPAPPSFNVIAPAGAIPQPSTSSIFASSSDCLNG